jgi:hypothetical protein
MVNTSGPAARTARMSVARLTRKAASNSAAGKTGRARRVWMMVSVRAIMKQLDRLQLNDNKQVNGENETIIETIITTIPHYNQRHP